MGLHTPPQLWDVSGCRSFLVTAQIFTNPTESPGSCACPSVARVMFSHGDTSSWLSGRALSPAGVCEDGGCGSPHLSVSVLTAAAPGAVPHCRQSL